ncbi:MAG: hypothetical protein ACRDVE_10170 [Actinocrinis sp.]
MNEFSPEMIRHLHNQLQAALQDAKRAETLRDEKLATVRYQATCASQHATRAQELGRLLAYADPDNAELYKAEAGEPKDMSKLETFLDGLRKLIEFYKLHPDVPVPSHSTITLYAHNAEPDEEIAGTARIAELMGVKARREAPNDHFRGTLVFGGSVTLETVSCKRTDSTWHTRDPLPQWFVQEQARYDGEGFAQSPDEDAQSAEAEPADPRSCDECGTTVNVVRARKGVGQAAALVYLCRTCRTLAIEAGEIVPVQLPEPRSEADR